MKAIRSIKLKFTGDHKADKILPNWLNACNWLSRIVFKSKEINSNRLHQAHYRTVREKFKLPSQLTCTLFRIVSASYKSQKTKKTWNLSIYKKYSIPIVWKRDFTINRRGMALWNNTIIINDPRIKIGRAHV